MIHREGYISILLSIIFCSCIVTLAYLYSGGAIFYMITIVCIILFLIVLQFFRNPVRQIPLKNDRLIYAPADGKVVVIENSIENEYIKGSTKQVSIFMSPNKKIASYSAIMDFNNVFDCQII